MTAASHDGSPAGSPLDVERVEWFASTPHALEVRVSGRWRDGASPGDGVELLVDDFGDRRGFAAGSAGSDAAGRWHGRFAVPVELRSRLSSRLALRVGGRELVLPAASPGPADDASAPAPATVVEPGVLAERRARREGLAEDGLVRRAHTAEATARTLEAQLDHLEVRLREAVAERERLTARLRAAEQREEAERRVRAEAEEERDDLAAHGRREVAELRARLHAAEEHAAALAGEMDAVRREGAEAQQAAAAARAIAERAGAGVGQELDALRREAAVLGERLADEHAARVDAEARLERESARVTQAEGAVAALERELDERRAEIARLQEQAELDPSRHGSAGRAVEALKATAGVLRERIAALHATERQARTDLRDAQAELDARGRDLARARAELDRARADLAAAEAADDGRAVALREAQRTVAAVRREVGDLRERLDDERVRRVEAETALRAERDAAGMRISEDQLAARVAEEMEAERRRSAELQALAAEVVEMAASLRDELTGTLDALAARVETEVAALRAQLEEERRARWVAEQRLTAARESVFAARPTGEAALSAGELEAMRRQLAAAQEQLAAERARSDDAASLREHAGKVVSALEAAEARLKVREEGLAPLEGLRRDAESLPERDPQPRVEHEPAPQLEHRPAPEQEPQLEHEPAPEQEPPPAEEPPEEPAPVEDPPEGEPGPVQEPPEGEPPVDVPVVLAPRIVEPRRRTGTPWLAPAIAALAERDEPAAAALVVELLPAQAGLISKPLSYTLVVEGHGAQRVELAADGVTAEPRPSAADCGDVDVRVSGRAGALAPLVAGGAPRRLRDVEVHGRKRRLRRLLRARRDPVDLAQLVERGVTPEPALLLAALAAAVDPAWTAGHDFRIAYAIDGAEDRVVVEVRDGARLVTDAAADPTATVSLTRDGLLRLLARVAPPAGEETRATGDADAVATLHAWFDRAQGLPAD